MVETTWFGERIEKINESTFLQEIIDFLKNKKKSDDELIIKESKDSVFNILNPNNQLNNDEIGFIKSFIEYLNKIINFFKNNKKNSGELYDFNPEKKFYDNIGNIDEIKIKDWIKFIGISTEKESMKKELYSHLEKYYFGNINEFLNFKVTDLIKELEGIVK